MSKIVLIGAGNLAWHLGSALINGGHQIVQVYSKTPQNAIELGDFLKATHTTDLSLIDPYADFYFLAIPDDTLLNLHQYLPFKDRFFIHCSGASPLHSIHKLGEKTGVLYPLQTFTKSVEINFSTIPILIETQRKQDFIQLSVLASTLSEYVVEANSEKRAKAHLSGVFANNFTNHLFRIAEEILQETDLSYQILFPIIAETVRKVFTVGPEKSQTGPAIRHDQTTIRHHLELLNSHPDYEALYIGLTDNIQKLNEKTTREI